MARSPKPTPKTPEPPPSGPTPVTDVTITYLRDLGRHFTVTPVQVYSGPDLKEGLRRVMAAQDAAIEALITDQLSKGLSLEEINEFPAIQMQVMPTVIERNGRQKVEWPFKLIGPND